MTQIPEATRTMSTTQATFGDIDAEPDRSEPEPTEIDRTPTGIPAAGFPRRVESRSQLADGQLVRVGSATRGARYRVVTGAATIELVNVRTGGRMTIVGSGPEFTRRDDSRGKELYLIGFTGDYHPPRSDRDGLLTGAPDREPDRTGAILHE
jgi:hypothetical protein